MINDQVLQAFKALLAHVDTAETRAQAAIELLEEKKLVDQKVLHAKIEEVKGRQKARVDALRSQIESILKEKSDF